MTGIICFGDSITRGENDVEKGGWVDRLKSFCMDCNIKEDSNAYSVYNLGISGESSLGFKSRFKGELFARNAGYDQTIITIGFGANDLAIQNGELMVSEQKYTAAIARCVEMAKSENTTIYLLSILPTMESEMLQRRKRNAQDIRSYNEALKKIALDFDVCYIDIHTPFKRLKEELLGGDGLHPNAKGHQFIFEMMKQKLFT